MKPFIFAAGLILVSSIPVLAEDLTHTNPVAATKSQPLSPLLTYVLKQGETVNCEAYLNRNLQLGDGDVAVLQKGWVGRDKLNHLVLVPQNDHGSIVILRYDKQVKGIGWLTSPDGRLRQTIEFDRTPHESHPVANESHAQEFELEKKFLLGKAAGRPPAK